MPAQQAFALARYLTMDDHHFLHTKSFLSIFPTVVGWNTTRKKFGRQFSPLCPRSVLNSLSPLPPSESLINEKLLWRGTRETANHVHARLCGKTGAQHNAALNCFHISIR
jgi:hypothetical protein